MKLRICSMLNRLNWFKVLKNMLHWLCKTHWHYADTEFRKTDRSLIVVVTSEMTASVNVMRSDVMSILVVTDTKMTQYTFYWNRITNRKHWINNSIRLRVACHYSSMEKWVTTTKFDNPTRSQQQRTHGQDRYQDVFSDVKSKIHYADDVKHEIRIYPPRLLFNQKRESALSMG